jgi:Tol biopolymer transport system component
MPHVVSTRLRLAATLALLAGGSLVPAEAARAAVGDMQLASRSSGATGVKGDDHSSEPKLSANGRFVAFVTTATNLDPADVDAAVPDVYVRDLETGLTTLVSRADGPDGAKGDAVSDAPAISADGRYVAFVSEATNLSEDESDADVADVFLRDLQQNTTTLVSRASDGMGGDAGSGSPAISADGRVVAFESDATNLASGDADAFTDVFARDVVEGTTVLVSGPGAAPRTGRSGQPSISADGTIVAFSSTVTGLDPDDVDPPDAPLSDVFTRDLRTGALALVSRSDGPAGEKGNDASESPAISGDGRLVAFSSAATNLEPADADSVADVFVRNLALSTTALVSRGDGPTGAKGDADSSAPALSHTGRFVVFTSLSPFDAADADTLADVYVRDVVAGRTRLLSRAAGVLGAKGDGASESPAISANARFVTYGSAATNLHPDDVDALTDIFVRDVLGTVMPLGTPPARTPPGAASPRRFAVAPASCPVDGAVTVLTDGRDVRTGGPGSDILVGRDGPDVLRGMGGADCLYGGRSADRLLGGAGDDLLSGGPGPDRIADARGRDRFLGGAGNDVIDARDASPRDRRRRDRVRCGGGPRDRAFVDRLDRVARDCERVTRAKAAR